MSFKLKKLSTHIVHVNEAKFFMDIVLGNINVEVVKTVLVKSRGFRSRSNIASHCVTDYSPTDWKMLSDEFC